MVLELILMLLFRSIDVFLRIVKMVIHIAVL